MATLQSRLVVLVLVSAVLTGCKPGVSGDGADANREDEVDAANTVDAAPQVATYIIEPGAHSARVINGTADRPYRGLSTVTGRDYHLAFNSTAAYILTKPVQPNDQLDWNKLPGLSDCGQLDVAKHGAMFGWRWRPETEPARLEVTAYANNDGIHITAESPLFSLSASELSAAAELHYRISINADQYSFSVVGDAAGRPINAQATLPRACPTVAANGLKWTFGLYFGGTSTAPQQITATITER